MIGRIVLETCANVEEAISLLKEIPHRRSFSYVLLDQTGKSIVVEASPREVILHQSNICTNHFDVLTHENRHRIDDSLQRYQAMKDHESHSLNANSAFHMMNSTEKVYSLKNMEHGREPCIQLVISRIVGVPGLPLEEINDPLSLILINGLMVKR